MSSKSNEVRAAITTGLDAVNLNDSKESIEVQMAKLETFKQRVNLINTIPSPDYDPKSTREPESPRLKAAGLALQKGLSLEPSQVPEEVTLTLWSYELYELTYSVDGTFLPEAIVIKSKTITSKDTQNVPYTTFFPDSNCIITTSTGNHEKKTFLTPFKDHKDGLMMDNPALIVQATSKKGSIYLYNPSTTPKPK